MARLDRSVTRHRPFSAPSKCDLLLISHKVHDAVVEQARHLRPFLAPFAFLNGHLTLLPGVKQEATEKTD